jgi:hypothetical protein
MELGAVADSLGKGAKGAVAPRYCNQFALLPEAVGFQSALNKTRLTLLLTILSLTDLVKLGKLVKLQPPKSAPDANLALIFLFRQVTKGKAL